VNIGGPPRPEDVCDCELKQKVAHGSGIEDVRIKKDSVGTHGLP
jgi:hypothetical protein